ncbi:MAG: bifunctional oligoribonuclease/PAP phosphatase NrnA [Eubacteriales bacterium]|jgi:phosphoesterase RecJ-like protein|nr:bifunctional oligoribonuclease/PAP phosphatase NrnA [Eubacteriales bacterium]
MNNITLKAAAEMLFDNDNILILTHIGPDGDTLGSAFAIKYMMTQKNVVIICDDKLPERLSFIGEGVLTRCPDQFTPGLVVSVDTASLALAGEYGQSFAGKIDLKFDHHPMSEEFARYNYIDESAAACGEIIADLIAHFGVLDKPAARALYAAISSDTGCFKYSNVTAETHRKTAVLLDTGIDHGDINQRLFDNKTRGEMTALRVTLELLKFYLDGSVASVCFTNETKAKHGLVDEDIGDISSVPREIAGVELGVVLKQRQDREREFKISMRSGPGIAANRLCAMFGGGGHRQAAGGVIEADSGEEAERTVMERVISALEDMHGDI